jgi:hypothetical protein
LTARVPAHHQRFACVPGADHGVLGHAQAHALAGFDEVVAEVTVARQPDPALQHAQLAAEPAQVHGVAGVDAKRRAACGAGRGAAKVPIELRIHHQSPVRNITMIILATWKIQ